MNTTIDMKRVWIFLGFAFGLAWVTGLVIYLTGGLAGSPVIPGTGIPLAVVLLALPYMWAPAIAHILTRVVTRQGWANSGLRLNFKRGWKFWLIAWFGPGILTLLGAAVFFLIFPNHFDSGLTTIREQLAAVGQPVPGNLWMFVLLQTVGAMLISPLVNSLFTFGEEFGWRGYLQPMLLPLGVRKAMIWMGVIWGVWHWPVILMGHNYGLEYPGAPFLGPLAMVWFTFVVGVFLGWATLRGGSVWPAVIGHAAVNGIAAIALLMITGTPNPLLGPAPTGLIGSIGFSLVALWLMLSPRAWGIASTDTQAAGFDEARGEVAATESAGSA
jgi:uncharacterized protein